MALINRQKGRVGDASEASTVEITTVLAEGEIALQQNLGTMSVGTKSGNIVFNSGANPIFTGLITEQVSVSTLTLGATSSVQTYTATGDFTIVDDLEDGESVTFIVTNAGFTPTYPTMTWWNAEPTLGTTDKIFFEKIGTTLYGSQVGSIA